MDPIDRPLQSLDVVDPQHQFSQEVTIASRLPRLAWVGGAFLLDEHIDGPAPITLYGPDSSGDRTPPSTRARRLVVALGTAPGGTQVTVRR